VPDDTATSVTDGPRCLNGRLHRFLNCVELVITGQNLVEFIAIGVFLEDDEVPQQLEKPLSVKNATYKNFKFQNGWRGWPRRGMLSLPPSIRIFVHALPTDMRKHFNGLSAIVSQAFGKNVLEGDYFVFVNRAKNRCKILYWDRDGLVVWAKRLERGGFQVPSHNDAASLCVEIDSVTLAMMIGGVDLNAAKRRKRYRAVAG